LNQQIKAIAVAGVRVIPAEKIQRLFQSGRKKMDSDVCLIKSFQGFTYENSFPFQKKK